MKLPLWLYAALYMMVMLAVALLASCATKRPKDADRRKLIVIRTDTLFEDITGITKIKIKTGSTILPIDHSGDTIFVRYVDTATRNFNDTAALIGGPVLNHSEIK